MSKDTASHSNGVNGNASRFDPTFTGSVINAVGPKANPRLAQVMNSLTKHLHDWMRENEITLDEYMAGIDVVSFQVSSIYHVSS
jgi:catechol 1,2-dioxygenase